MHVFGIPLLGLNGSTARQVLLSLAAIAAVFPHPVRDCLARAARHLGFLQTRIMEMGEPFDHAGIGIASATYDVVGFPPIRLEGPVAEKIAERLDPRTTTEAPRR